MAMAEMVADFMTKPLQLQGSIFNKISKDLIMGTIPKRFSSSSEVSTLV